MANASVLIGYAAKEHPSNTLWVTLANQNAKQYYFCNAHIPFVMWLDVNETGFSDAALKIDVVSQVSDSQFEDHSYSGNVIGKLKPVINFLCSYFVRSVGLMMDVNFLILCWVIKL
ncbi:hypothetical protein [Spartinivicinus poritis]|uniref:Uncharacterized protein n=1 Tax=Spartinivicinus poritis TaxID=2994640 RepID=A0ABT5UHR0_9GAMM|nr:hypothetical protein [Spartinivicinus sp. A2-2]MDE1465905.1 hypothetical protein [Spartinivicinus sp. A2-2]